MVKKARKMLKTAVVEPVEAEENDDVVEEEMTPDMQAALAEHFDHDENAM